MSEETPFTTPPVSDPQPATDAPGVNGTQPVGPPAAGGEEAPPVDLAREVTLTVRTLEDINIRLGTIEAELLALIGALALAAVIVWKSRRP